MKVIGDSKVTSKFQATIPPPVRELLRLESGDRIMFLTEGSHVLVKKGKLEVQS
jgi:AbrB family looped-hinge helix DNA binding protein